MSPGIAVEVEDVGNGMPTFVSRGRSPNREPLVYKWHIGDQDGREWCVLFPVAAASREPSSWHYGEHVAGYAVKGCAPLSPGSYVVTIDAAGGMGMKQFDVPPRAK